MIRRFEFDVITAKDRLVTASVELFRKGNSWSNRIGM